MPPRQDIEKIRKRDGTVVPFSQEKVVTAIFKAATAVGGKDRKRAEFLAGEVIAAIKKKFPGNRIPTVEHIQDIVEHTLIEQGHAKTAKAYILYRDQQEKFRKERVFLIGRAESNRLSLNAIRLLRERYLLRDKTGHVVETPNEMFRRVAEVMASVETTWGKRDVAALTEDFYQMMFHLDFLPNTPTLMNAGKKNQQLISCFVLPVEDSIDDIFSTLRLAMRIQKTGAGTGFSFSQLRESTSLIRSNGTRSSGPVSFMKIFDEATGVLKRGGKKRGANMGVLRVDHPDILEFIHAKDQEGVMVNFNVSVGVTDAFMEAVVKNEEYALKDPQSKETVAMMSARYVWDSFIAAAWTNGDPGILFLDRMNKDNVTETFIEATSPCAEAPLLANESCILGSLNVGRFVLKKGKERSIDWDRLKVVIHLAVRFLDNALEGTVYPTEEIKHATLAYRKIGLGMMGLADLFVGLGVPYNSEKGVETVAGLMKFIRKEADNASEALAEERGVFSAWKKTKYGQGKRTKKLRNATRLSIAPTGSLSMIADCSSGIEPLFAISYIKRVLGGKEFFYIDGNFRDALKEAGLYKEGILQNVVNQASIQHIETLPGKLRRVFVVAHDINPEWHLKIQAACQQHVDNAISKTVNFANMATMKDIERVYMQAWKNGCKGITIYRDGSKPEQVVQLSFKK